MKSLFSIIGATILVIVLCVFQSKSCLHTAQQPSPTVFSLTDTTWITSLKNQLADPYYQSEYGTYPSVSFGRLNTPLDGFDISFAIINEYEPEFVVIPFYRILRLADSREFFINCEMEINSYCLYAGYCVDTDSIKNVFATQDHVDDGIYYFSNEYISPYYDSESDTANSRIELRTDVMFQFVDVNLDGKKELLLNNQRNGSSGGCDFVAVDLSGDDVRYCNYDIPNGWINGCTMIDTLNKRLYLYDGFYTFAQGLYVYTRVNDLIRQEELPDTNMTVSFMDSIQYNHVLTKYVKWAKDGTYFKLDSIYLRNGDVIAM